MKESCLENLHFAHFICLSFVCIQPFPKFFIPNEAKINITSPTPEEQKRVQAQIKQSQILYLKKHTLLIVV